MMSEEVMPFRLMIRTGTVAAMSICFHAASVREARAKAARIVHRLHVDRGSRVELADATGRTVAPLELPLVALS